MAILFQDNANRADNASLGADWIEDTDNYEINGNEFRSDTDFLTYPAASGSAWVTALAARADMNVQARLRTSGTAPIFSRAGLVARRTATNTYYAIALVTNVGDLRLDKLVAGTATNLGSVATADQGAFHTFRLEVFGDQLKVYRDNVLVIGPVTDTSITAAGRAGLYLSGDTGGPDRGHADDFFVADVAGNIDPNQVDSDQVIPLQFKYSLVSDLVIPVQFRYVLNADSVIPLEWDISGLIRSDHTAPLQIRTQINADLIIPLLIQLPGGIVADFVIPLQFRKLVESDHIIPILWKLFTDWVAQAGSEAPAWTQQAAGEADAWTKQGASQADAWTKV